jgi:hypothetical protein
MTDERQRIVLEVRRLLDLGGKENRRLAEDLCDLHNIVMSDSRADLTYYPNMTDAQRARFDQLLKKREDGSLDDDELNELEQLGYPFDRDDEGSLRGLWISSSMRC